MKQVFQFFIFSIMLLWINTACGSDKSIIVAAEQPNEYLHLLVGKKVGLMVNHTSMVDSVHLLDFLLSQGVMVDKVFAVEHGFRGDAADGELIDHSIDHTTGIPIVSLYGSEKKANKNQMQGLDIVIFDMQDVGCRFYTYISSMHYMMEACAENDISFFVFDRPNPNGDYIAGPVLDMELKSFVGMHPIPIVHGCTVGELAQMINGENWLNDGIQCDLKVFKVKNYTHSCLYKLPINPSPNLPNHLSVRLYPSLCFFEATNVSIGRGTKFPFQVIGYPGSPVKEISFTPKSIPGMSNNPLHENILCHGIDLKDLNEVPPFTLEFFIRFFNYFENHDDFWKSRRWIDLLSGDKNFYQQINSGIDAQSIKAAWENGIQKYKHTRKKYLLYPDFE